MMALILASGIDPKRSIVFHQDEVTPRVALPLKLLDDTSNRYKTIQNLLGF